VHIRNPKGEKADPGGSTRIHEDPSGSIRIHQDPSGSTRIHEDPSGSKDPGSAFSPLINIDIKTKSISQTKLSKTKNIGQTKLSEQKM